MPGISACSMAILPLLSILNILYDPPRPPRSAAQPPLHKQPSISEKGSPVWCHRNTFNRSMAALAPQGREHLSEMEKGPAKARLFISAFLASLREIFCLVTLEEKWSHCPKGCPASSRSSYFKPPALPEVSEMTSVLTCHTHPKGRRARHKLAWGAARHERSPRVTVPKRQAPEARVNCDKLSRIYPGRSVLFRSPQSAAHYPFHQNDQRIHRQYNHR